MNSPEPSAPSDDLFASLLESLAEPEPGELDDTRAAGAEATPVVGPPATQSDAELDDALFPDLVIDLSDDDRPETPTDVGELTADDDAARWGPDAAAPSDVDPVAIAELFPEDDATRRAAAPIAIGSFEPRQPWWENRRILAAIGIAAVAVIVLAGFAFASRGSDDEGDDLATESIPDTTVRNDDAAVTTTIPEAGPPPSGLPVPPTEAETTRSTTTTKKPATTTTTRRPAPTTRPPAPAPAPTPPPPTEQVPPPTPEPPPDPPPVDSNVAWGRAMAARTSPGLFTGWSRGSFYPDDSGVGREAYVGFRFDEGAGILYADLRVKDAPEYDLTGIALSIVPDVEARSTPWNGNLVRLLTNGNRDVRTEAPDKLTIGGPVRPDFVRLEVAALDSFTEPVFDGVYEFR